MGVCVGRGVSPLGVVECDMGANGGTVKTKTLQNNHNGALLSLKNNTVYLKNSLSDCFLVGCIITLRRSLYTNLSLPT